VGRATENAPQCSLCPLEFLQYFLSVCVFLSLLSQISPRENPKKERRLVNLRGFRTDVYRRPWRNLGKGKNGGNREFPYELEGKFRMSGTRWRVAASAVACPALKTQNPEISRSSLFLGRASRPTTGDQPGI